MLDDPIFRAKLWRAMEEAADNPKLAPDLFVKLRDTVDGTPTKTVVTATTRMTRVFNAADPPPWAPPMPPRRSQAILQAQQAPKALPEPESSGVELDIPGPPPPDIG